MAWLRKQKHEQPPGQDDAPSPAPAETPYVPASMRPRPITVPPAVQEDDIDPDDGHIAFFAAIAEQVDRERVPDAAPRPASAARVMRDDGDEMWAFRDNGPALDPYDGVRQHVPDDVAIDDLLDELSMTAAALRHRRAA